MGKSSSVIEINGNRYDAVTGQLIGAVKKVASQFKTPSAGVIDGMVRTSSSVRPANVKKVVNSVKNMAAAKTASRLPSQTIHSGAQRSRTLVRDGLKKPVAKRANDIEPKGRTARISPTKLLRANSAIQNAKVRRFGRPSPGPKPQSVRPLTPSTVAKAKPVSAVAIAPAPPSMVTSVSHYQLERILDQALFRADAHKQALRAQIAGNNPWQRLKLMPKWLSVGTSVLAVLLLGGFFAWQNIPQISMRVAAARDHVSASLPAYTPVGFKYASPVSSTASGVTVQFKAQSDPAQKYTVTQQSSNWDSSSLAANAIPQNTPANPPQTMQVNGTTVYIYGANHDATWVNNGVKYDITNQANLSPDELLKIANSL